MESPGESSPWRALSPSDQRSWPALRRGSGQLLKLPEGQFLAISRENVLDHERARRFGRPSPRQHPLEAEAPSVSDCRFIPSLGFQDRPRPEGPEAASDEAKASCFLTRLTGED